MLTLCYLIARCAGGTLLARLALRQGKVMPGARTNAEGKWSSQTPGSEEILRRSSRLWGGRVATQSTDLG